MQPTHIAVAEPFMENPDYKFQERAYRLYPAYVFAWRGKLYQIDRVISTAGFIYPREFTTVCPHPNRLPRVPGAQLIHIDVWDCDQAIEELGYRVVVLHSDEEDWLR